MSVLREDCTSACNNTEGLVEKLKLRMNQWLLELFNRIELLDACAENRFRGSLTLEYMWVCRNY